MKIYTEDDFAKVVDHAGNELPAVPKTWLDKSNGLLPEGVKRAGRSSSSSSSTSSSRTGGGNGGSGGSNGPQEPAGNASTEDWAAYAKAKGASDGDLVDGKGEPLGRDELRAKYGTAAS